MHMCDILHLHVWHQSPNNMHQEPPSTLMRRIYMWKSYTCVQWHIHRCEMTLKWLIPMCRRRCWSRKYRHQPRSSGGGSRWWWLALLEWAGRCCPWALWCVPRRHRLPPCLLKSSHHTNELVDDLDFECPAKNTIQCLCVTSHSWMIVRAECAGNASMCPGLSKNSISVCMCTWNMQWNKNQICVD